MTAGHARLDLRGNPLAMAAGNAVLDVMRRPAPGAACAEPPWCSSRSWRRSRISIPPSSPRCAVKGLLVGLRALVPNGELVDELRAEKTITAAAGRQCGAAAAAADRERGRDRRGGQAHRTRLQPLGPKRTKECARRRSDESDGLRHFLDLTDISKATLRGMLEASRAMKGQAQRRGRTQGHGRTPARRQDGWP